jgi:hypothetical protein
MKLASILSLVALAASPLAASAENCTVSGEYFLNSTDYDDDPSDEDIDSAAYFLMTSYNAVYNISSSENEAHDYWVSSFNIDTTEQLGESEEKQVAENLRGKVGSSWYSAYLGAGFSVNCHLCNDDDDSVASSAVINPAVSVVAGEKRLVAQKKHQEEKWLGVEDVLERWKEDWCNQLVDYDYVFRGAVNCNITITCPTA